MEVIRKLITRLRHAGVLFLVGLLLIIYVAFGFVYWQQGAEQKELEKQIVKVSAVISRPLPSAEKLQAEYDNVTLSLAPMIDSDAIALLVGIAEKNGIDVDKDSGNFRVSPVTYSPATVSGSKYQVVSFRNVHVQDDYDDVMAFISDLDSGTTLETMVLRGVTTKGVIVKPGGEEGARRAEFRNVISAVTDMMVDNALSSLPYPETVATSNMSLFPDITTAAVEKGYTGTGSPGDGYVLYGHDKIPTGSITYFETVNYVTTPSTEYYYTCTANWTVRQFDGADIATATEYLESDEFKLETIATVDVDIYIKPRE